MMDLTLLIKQPELMDKETLFGLRGLVARYPYYQPARLLLLQNLYLLHDALFDEELRRAAVYISDRKVLFQLIEAAHYELNYSEKTKVPATEVKENESRTVALIDNFLDSIPNEQANETGKTGKRRPTPADATVDYVAYLLEMEEDDDKQDDVPQMAGQSLIDEFISKEGGKIELKETPEYTPDMETMQGNDEENDDSGFFTETLAQIYIKQGKYDKALEIIKRLNLIYPKKNRYFADQIRFLEKLIINNKK